MRECKFRGKDIETGEWRYGWYLEIGGKPYIRTFPNKKGVSWDYFIEDDSAGQFTGIKDKNEVEIYEGAVVSHLNPKCKGEVLLGQYESGDYDTYVYGNGFYINRELDHYGKVHHEPLDFSDDIEVIGNITDNPELKE